MTEKCYEIGTIQAFLDGELDNETLAQVAHHVSVCDDCALALTESESESAFAFAALDEDLNYLVPTERIRANLYEQIRAEKKSFWKEIFGNGFRWTNPSAAAFAGLIVVVGIFASLLVLRENNQLPGGETATLNQPRTNEISAEKKQAANDFFDSAKTDLPTAKDSEIEKPRFRAEKAVVKTAAGNRPVTVNAVYRQPKFAVENQTASENKTVNGASPLAANRRIAGEESYLKTIATLNETVNSRKEQTLRASERVSFEKDLAIVNDSIAKMQKEVRSNPKNDAARELLRTSYQNKIDLLSSVADKSETMALR